MLVCPIIDTRIHNGLETLYSLRVRAQYGHMMTLISLPGAFPIDTCFICLEDRYILFAKP